MFLKPVQKVQIHSNYHELFCTCVPGVETFSQYIMTPSLLPIILYLYILDLTAIIQVLAYWQYCYLSIGIMQSLMREGIRIQVWLNLGVCD